MESLLENITLVTKVCEIYDKLSKLQTLKPCNDVDNLFTELVHTCIPHSSINIATLPDNIQEIRSKLVRLCGEAEGHLEAHFSTILGWFKNPLHHLNVFPYYSNYLKLSRLEYDILNQHYSTSSQAPKNVAFVGSGPLPLTSILLAYYHLKETTFHNYDSDSLANLMASRLVASDDDLSRRMVFHTADIMDVTDELKEYDVIFLAALVGMDADEKVKIIQHLAKYMAPGAILMLRSAHGARAFLYQVVDPQVLQGFDILSILHPDDDVINSVVISRKCWKLANTIDSKTLLHNLSFANVITVGNPSLKAILDRFTNEILGRKNPLHQSNLYPTFEIEVTMRPLIVTNRSFYISPNEFSTKPTCDHHFSGPIGNLPLLRRIHNRICGRVFCHRQCCDRLVNPSQICCRILRKKLPLL